MAASSSPSKPANAVDVLIYWALEHHREYFDERLSEELDQLDAKFFALCQETGVLIPDMRVDGFMNWGQCQLPYHPPSRMLGARIEVTPAWWQAMQGVKEQVATKLQSCEKERDENNEDDKEACKLGPIEWRSEIEPYYKQPPKREIEPAIKVIPRYLNESPSSTADAHLLILQVCKRSQLDEASVEWALIWLIRARMLNPFLPSNPAKAASIKTARLFFRDADVSLWLAATELLWKAYRSDDFSAVIGLIEESEGTGADQTGAEHVRLDRRICSMSNNDRLRAFRGKACRVANRALDFVDNWQSGGFDQRPPEVPNSLVEALGEISDEDFAELPERYSRVEESLRHIARIVMTMRANPDHSESWEPLQSAARTICETARKIDEAEGDEQLEGRRWTGKGEQAGGARDQGQPRQAEKADATDPRVQSVGTMFAANPSSLQRLLELVEAEQLRRAALPEDLLDAWHIARHRKLIDLSMIENDPCWLTLAGQAELAQLRESCAAYRFPPTTPAPGQTDRADDGQGEKNANGAAGGEEKLSSTDDESQRWLKVSEAATVSGCNPGIITRAVNNGDLKGNGKTDRERRVDAIDLVRWQLKRAGKPEPTESDEAVERMVKKHVRD